MTQPYVEFSEVWKKFRRGVFHDSLRDLVPALLKRATGRRPAADDLARNEFWAVRDVSFSVAPGEALGIIGPNGAGKSTILKLLTRILRPTRGLARIQGRTGALIEIAAGFHPDLSGRENVYLQGAIMGMRRDEITAQFDRIVEFAGLSEFMETQVKRYSSGMNARLGFAIAAHLDPEVLIVDEVLAVGDRAFQRKAFHRLGEMMNRNIPVVIVSHQLDRVASLCSKAIVLDRGKVACAGSAAECISHYLTTALAEPGDELEVDTVRVDRISLEPDLPIASGDPFRVEVEGRVVGNPHADLAVGLRVRRAETGEEVFGTSTLSEKIQLPRSGAFEIGIDLLAHLAGGIYLVEAFVWDGRRHREATSGVRTLLHVRQDHPFHGLVNLEAQMRVSPLRSGGPA